MLPRLPSEINVVVIEKPNSRTHVTEDLRVRRHYVEAWLRFLKANSQVPGYQNMVISQANIDSLPADGVPTDLPTLVDENIDFVDQLRVDPEDADFPFVDVDANPATDTGVFLPPNNLATGIGMIENVVESLIGES